MSRTYTLRYVQPVVVKSPSGDFISRSGPYKPFTAVDDEDYHRQKEQFLKEGWVKLGDIVEGRAEISSVEDTQTYRLLPKQVPRPAHAT